MKRIIPLTPRRWLALDIFRRMKHETSAQTAFLGMHLTM